MHIERVQIEEGFLDGLDVSFSAGLNVVIGARGTGKTSLIELIRFCLNVGAGNEQSRRSRDHALSILSTGQVTVTLNNQGERVFVSRTASDQEPRSSGWFAKPMIFSQTEIETVGLEASGRLRLIDGFISRQSQTTTEDDKYATEVRSLTAEIERHRRELEELEKQILLKPEIEAANKENEIARLAVAQSSAGLDVKARTLADLTTKISNHSTIGAEYTRVKNDAAQWYTELKASITSPIALRFLEEKMVMPHKPKTDLIKARLDEALTTLAELYHMLVASEKWHLDNKLLNENSTRQLRSEVEGLQAGSGQIMRNAQEFSERLAKIAAMESAWATKSIYLDQLKAQRGKILELLDNSRNQRFAGRLEVVNMLNAELSPNIRIHIRRNGQHVIFANALGEVLKKSGIKYGEIVLAISANISPRALLDAVEGFDVELVSDAARITTERASRILAHLKTCDLGTLSTIDIEDEVILQLLDGRDYKGLQDLSTGQRCTVVLPLVLAHHDRILIVDQPEDHIDNAFISTTLIKAVLARTANSQIIFSTHNPNIPVLGEADTVLHLGSDGRRGFKLCLGPLSDQSVVSSISTVMEGGADAFRRRADFYAKMHA